MYSVVGKLLGATSIVGGIIATPAVGGLLSISKREVFLLAQSPSGRTKLFLEEKKGADSKPIGLPSLKVIFNGKDISGQFSLCSPTGKLDDYYLLKWGDSWRINLINGKSISECTERARESLGEKLLRLNVKPSSLNGSTELLKEIDLKNCEISDLRKEGSKDMFKLTCGEVWAQHKNSNKKVEIFSLGLDYI